MADTTETAATTTPAAPRVARLELIKELGRGSIGVVYKAKNTELDRMVALRQFQVPQWLDDVDELLKRIVAEARNASGLQHPNIARLYTCGYKDFTVFTTAEFVEAPSLREVLSARIPPFSEILEFTRQLCAALDYASSKGVAHHMLNPSNIRIASDGSLKVLDFGLLRDKNLLSQTPVKKLEDEPYQSPEQIRNHLPDRAANLFTVGTIVYEMLTGRNPFAGKHLGEVDRNITDYDPHPLPVANSRVPEPVSKVVLKALSKNPADRYKTGEEFVTALEDALKAAPVHAPAAATSTAQRPAAESTGQVKASAGANATGKVAAAIPTPKAPATTTRTTATTRQVAVAKKSSGANSIVDLFANLRPEWKLGGAVFICLVVVATLAITLRPRPAEPAPAPQAETPAIASPAPAASAPEEEIKVSEVTPERSAPRTTRSSRPVRAAAPVVAVAAATGQISVSSVPIGATVAIEGRPGTWQTPQSISALPAGVYKLTISKAGFAPQTRIVEVARGASNSVDVRLTPLNGFITVSSAPSSATILIDGRDTGKLTPAQFSLDSAPHTIVVRRDGYLDASQDFRLEAGQSLAFSPTLKTAGRTDNLKVVGGFSKIRGSQGMARISIKTDPKGAQVTVNGTQVSKSTPLEIQVEPGYYDIVVQKDGYKPIHKSINAGIDDKIKLEESLSAR
ncbi:MAG TPA: serine/threonine-protein kinase [Alphaproteobacteria bacterium]|nr:serine/threonine-protein kinase [Alphaproteobacteria bacterium]